MSSHFIRINPKKSREKYLFTKNLETNNTTEDKTKSKSSLTINNSKKPFSKIKYTKKEIKKNAYNYLVKKYNILPYKYNLIQIDNYVSGKYCHSLASFKEELMFNYGEEFLKKIYKIKEIKKKIPLFYEFYKSYLQFFCTPIFSDLSLNELIEKTVEKKAKAFYNENYKEEPEPEKKGKTLNVVIFTSKIRRDLSRITNLTNISRTTILEPNLTNKNSFTSANSIAKIFNEIGSSHNINNKNIIKNKSYNNKIGKDDNNGCNINSILNINYKNNLANKKKNMNLQLKIGNSENNSIKENIKVKDKININKINTTLSLRKNNINIIKNNPIFTDINTKNKKLSIKKKTVQIIKIKNSKKNIINNPSLATSVKIYINKSHNESKQSPLSYNINKSNNSNRNNNSNTVYTLGNNTTTNISHYNKKVIRKPNSRNYVCDFVDNISTFTHMNSNLINKMNSKGNNISNNFINSKNSLNNENITKLKSKKSSKINKEDKILLNKNNAIKKTIEEPKRIVNVFKDKYKTNNITYNKNYPYKKPDTLYGNKNSLKKNSDIGKKISNKVNNFITFQAKHKASNIKTSWNKKDNNILYKKQKLTSNSIKENNKKYYS